MLVQLIKTALDILRLRAGPQDMPSGAACVQLSVVLFLASYVIAISAFFPFGESMIRAGLDLVLSILFVALLLQVRGHPARLQQTLCALFSTGFLLNLVAWPLFAVLAERIADEPDAAPGEGAAMLSLLVWGLYAWSLVVSAHIYRHALQVLFAAGLLLALGYFFLAMSLSELLLGGAG